VVQPCGGEEGGDAGLRLRTHRQPAASEPLDSLWRAEAQRPTESTPDCEPPDAPPLRNPALVPLPQPLPLCLTLPLCLCLACGGDPVVGAYRGTPQLTSPGVQAAPLLLPLLLSLLLPLPRPVAQGWLPGHLWQGLRRHGGRRVGGGFGGFVDGGGGGGVGLGGGRGKTGGPLRLGPASWLPKASGRAAVDASPASRSRALLRALDWERREHGERGGEGGEWKGEGSGKEEARWCGRVALGRQGGWECFTEPSQGVPCAATARISG